MELRTFLLIDSMQPQFAALTGTLMTGDVPVEGNAELIIERMAVRVRCSQCDAESEAAPNRLICSRCGDFRTSVVSGEEMILASVELAMAQG